jgi:hypothetical protein
LAAIVPVLIYKTGAQNKQLFHFPKSAEQRKKWIEVLVTSGIPPSKLQNYFTSSQKN